MPNQRQNQVNGNSCETSVIDFDIEVDESEHLARFKWHYVSKSWYFMVYRWIFAMIVIANFIISTYQHITTVHSGVYLIYLSEWNIVLNMIVGVLGALVVTICHFHTDFYQGILSPFIRLLTILFFFKFFDSSWKNFWNSKKSWRVQTNSVEDQINLHSPGSLLLIKSTF